MNVIYILWLRQIKRFIRSKARLVGSLGQPLLYFLAFGFGFGPVYAKAGGGNYLEFLAPGVIAMSILFTAVFSGIEMIWDRQFGFLKETFVAPVPRIQVVLGRILGGATVSFVQGLIVLILTVLTGFRFSNLYGLPLAFLFMFLIAVLFTAIGTALASIMEDMHGFQLVINFLIMPIFFLSGAMFPLAGLPKALAVAAAIDPLSYGVDGLRGALSNTAHFGMATDLMVLLAGVAVCLTLAVWLFKRIRM